MKINTMLLSFSREKKYWYPPRDDGRLTISRSNTGIHPGMTDDSQFLEGSQFLEVSDAGIRYREISGDIPEETKGYIDQKPNTMEQIHE